MQELWMSLVDELSRLTLAQVAEKIRNGAVSPVEITRVALDRTEQLNPSLNAAITILHKQALENARQAEREIMAGDYHGPLHGVPVGIKVLADYSGVTTTAGSHLFDETVASSDSDLVVQLRRAGAVITTKLNCDEFAFHSTGATSAYGPSRNPWDTDIVSGGSSGGSGVAVATGMVYAALGTDTGGSVRMPSAACGIVGIKPTYGRISLNGVHLLSPTFDTPGAMARTTLDASLMLQALFDPKSDRTMRESNRMKRLIGEIDTGLEGLRIGIPSNYFFDGNDEEVNTIVRTAIDALAMLGAELVVVDIPAIEEIVASWWGIVVIEGYTLISEATNGDLTRVNSILQERLRQGIENSLQPGESLRVALGRYRAMRDDALSAYQRATGAIDVLVTPTLRRPPPRITDAHTEGGWMGDLTRPFNATHQPVVCVPCGWTSTDLPVGLQIVATKYRERIAIRVANAYAQSDHAPDARWPSDDAIAMRS